MNVSSVDETSCVASLRRPPPWQSYLQKSTSVLLLHNCEADVPTAAAGDFSLAAIGGPLFRSIPADCRSP